MSEQTGNGQGRDAAAAAQGAAQPGGADGDDPQQQVRNEGERMARKLVQDVAAFEVDPPPPARVQEDLRDPSPTRGTGVPAE